MRNILIFTFISFIQTMPFAMTYNFVGAYFPEILEVNSQGKVQGSGAEITYQIARNLNVDINIKLYPLKRALAMVKSGDADAIIGPYKSEERSKYIDYTAFHFYEDQILLYARDNSKINWKGNLQALRGLEIGVARGWSLGDDLDFKSNNVKIVYVDKLEQLFSMLQLGRIDMFIAHPRSVSNAYVSPKTNSAIKALYPALTSNKGFFGFSKKKGLKEFKAKFEAEYKKLKMIETTRVQIGHYPRN